MVLIRIVVLLFLGIGLCHAQQPKYHIIWEDGQPKGIETIFSDDFLFSKETLQFQLAGSEQKILGEKYATDSSVIFKPIIPFSYNVDYKVYAGMDYGYTFSIAPTKNAPLVKAIYPLGDTVPSNFLKLYIEFDQPMGEGRANEFVELLHDGKVVENAFLLLQPELWNADHTVLTLWLEPGRIKRDLGPNKKLGPILQEGNTYEVVVNQQFSSNVGLPLQNEFKKTYYVGNRDSKSPDVKHWQLEKPAADDSPLIIHFDEPLSLKVAVNAMKVMHQGTALRGSFVVISDKSIAFKPQSTWQKGNYIIEVESRVEDLAGNNLNRLFDQDLKKLKAIKDQQVYKISFRVD